MIYVKDGVEYTDKFWTCACSDEYVHAKEADTGAGGFCPVCGSTETTAPDAPVKETLYLLHHLNITREDL